MKITHDSIDIGIVVTDIDASLRFYCGDLELEKLGELELPGNRVMHRLQAGTSMIKLQELRDDTPPRGPDGILAQAGIRYLTIWVAGIHSEVERLTARGCTFSRPLQEIRDGVYIAMLEDPDGNTVELIEMTDQ